MDPAAKEKAQRQEDTLPCPIDHQEEFVLHCEEGEGVLGCEIFDMIRAMLRLLS